MKVPALPQPIVQIFISAPNKPHPQKCQTWAQWERISSFPNYNRIKSHTVSMPHTFLHVPKCVLSWANVTFSCLFAFAQIVYPRIPFFFLSTHYLDMYESFILTFISSVKPQVKLFPSYTNTIYAYLYYRIFYSSGLFYNRLFPFCIHSI